MRLMTRIHRLANDTGCTVVPSVDEVVNKADTARGDSEQTRAEAGTGELKFAAFSLQFLVRMRR